MHAAHSLAHYDEGKLGVTFRDLVKTPATLHLDLQMVQLWLVTSSLNKVH